MKLNYRQLLLMLCSFVFIQLAQIGSVQADDSTDTGTSPLVVSIDADGVDSTLAITVSNVSGAPVTFLAWDTPFENKLNADAFQVIPVTKGWSLDNRATYIGYRLKRGVPDENAYITLDPGASLTRMIDISDSYSVDKTGGVSINYQQDLLLVNTGITARTASTAASGATQTARVAARGSVTLEKSIPQSLRYLPPNFSGCSASQESTISTVVGRTETSLGEAYDQLLDFTPEQVDNSPRYRAWFGRYNESRHNTVMSTLSNLVTALGEQELTFDCGSCVIETDGTAYAYVYPSRPWRIYLCPLFFNDIPEQVNAVAHELSHFPQVGSTDDFVYGPPASLNLAATNPANAVRNADNYGYFASNNLPETLPLVGTVNEDDEPQLPANEFATLEAGQTVTGQVDVGRSNLFVLTGATTLQLDSSAGDADLYVFSDPALTSLVCESTRATEPDVCEFQTPRTLYIEVYGYETSSYSLTSGAVEVDDSFIALVPGETVQSNVAEGNLVIYQVSGVESITLESLTGDADLYIYSSPGLESESLVCESYLFTDESAEDFCRVSEGQLYVVVFGFEASDYTIYASNGEGGNNDNTTVVALAAGESYSGSLQESDIEVFTMTGPGRLDLTSETGDADLIVFVEDNLDEPFCISNELPAVSRVDSCQLDSDDYAVAVLGYTSANYVLSFTSSDDIPVITTTDTGNDDDTEIADNPEIQDDTLNNPDNTDSFADTSSGGSGGGGAAFLLIGLMLLHRALCRAGTVVRRRYAQALPLHCLKG